MPKGRLHPALRVALYLPAIAITGMLILIPLGFLWQLAAITRALPSLSDLTLHSQLQGGLVAQGVLIVAALLITCVFRRFLDRRSVASLGLQLESGWGGEALAGFLLGALLMALIFVTELLLGGYRVRGPGWSEQSPVAVLAWIAAFFLVFIVVAFYEELLARGYILQNLASAWGLRVAVVVSSMLFSLAHLNNPGANPVSTLGLFFAGLLLSGGYLATRRLWLPIGLHLAWNFFQGPVFGFPVSGVPTVSLVRLEPFGPDVLTGGGFGPEASLIGVASEVLGIGLLWLWYRRRAAAAPVGPGCPAAIMPRQQNL